ncbi:MAG TPA: TetR/AcrR family transcriptional regulator [Acidimicrobiales bacterium]
MAAGTGTTSALTRERVVVAAIALAEREGLAELSMRRLAAALGAGTMSLYNHVSDKEDLYDGMVEAVLAPVRIADSVHWREIVATWATDSRQVLLDRIDLIPLVIAPQRLVHLSRISGAVGSALEQAGLERDAAATVVRVVGRYFAGAVLLDAPRLRTGGVSRAALDRTFATGLGALLTGLEAEVVG